MDDVAVEVPLLFDVTGPVQVQIQNAGMRQKPSRARAKFLPK